MTGMVVAILVLQSVSTLAILSVSANLAKLTDAVFRGRR